MDLDTLQWFEAQKHPDALPLYEALEGRILAEIPGVRIKVQKSQSGACPICGRAKRRSCRPVISL